MQLFYFMNEYSLKFTEQPNVKFQKNYLKKTAKSGTYMQRSWQKWFGDVFKNLKYSSDSNSSKNIVKDKRSIEKRQN